MLRIDRLPCAPAQEGIWFMERAYPMGRAYAVEAWWELTGPLDVSALDQAVRDVVGRHPALRATFHATPDGPRQLIGSRVHGLELVDHADELAWDGQRLDEGPLLCARLLALAPDRHRLWIGVHHIVCDALSMAIVYGDLGVAYRARLAGAAADLPGDPGYAEFCRSSRVTPELTRRAAEVADELRDLPQPRFGQPDAVASPHLGDLCHQRMRAPSPARLAAFARSRRTTEFAVLFAAFAASVQRLSGQDRLVIATPVSLREDEEQMDTVGLLVNTVPVVVDLTGEPGGLTVDELLLRVRAALLAAFERRDVPLSAVARQSGQGQPLFTLMFGVEALTARLELTGVEVNPLPTTATHAPFDLDLLVERDQDGWRLKANHAIGPLPRRQLERLLSTFAQAAAAIVELPGDRPVGRLWPDPPARPVRPPAAPASPPREVVGVLAADPRTLRAGLAAAWRQGATPVLLDPEDDPMRLAWLADAISLTSVVVPPGVGEELAAVLDRPLLAPATEPLGDELGDLLFYQDDETALHFPAAAVAAHVAARRDAEPALLPAAFLHGRAFAALAGQVCTATAEVTSVAPGVVVYGARPRLAVAAAGGVVLGPGAVDVVDVSVLDASGRPAAEGVPGELVLGGPGVVGEQRTGVSVRLFGEGWELTG